jgi:hypothetical protein
VLRVETSERALSFGPRMVALCVFHPYAVSDPEIAVRVFRELHKCPVYPQLCLPLLTRCALHVQPGAALVLPGLWSAVVCGPAMPFSGPRLVSLAGTPVPISPAGRATRRFCSTWPTSRM